MNLKTGLLRAWRDPVWSKVIAAGIIASISLLFIQMSKTLSSVFYVGKATIVVVSATTLILSVCSIVLLMRRRASRQRPEKDTSQEQRPSPAALDIPIPGNIPRECLPGFQTSESIEELRQKGGARPLTSEENQLSLWELPDDVFGYADAYKLNSPQVTWKMINTSDIEQNFLLNKDLCLYGNPLSTGYVEIHKYKDCSIHLVCYATEEDRITLQNPSRSQPVKVTVSLDRTPKRKKIIAIPRQRLIYWRVRILGDGEYVADATIS